MPVTTFYPVDPFDTDRDLHELYGAWLRSQGLDTGVESRENYWRQFVRSVGGAMDDELPRFTVSEEGDVFLDDKPVEGISPTEMLALRSTVTQVELGMDTLCHYAEQIRTRRRKA
jgi:hypothetical protein